MTLSLEELQIGRIARIASIDAGETELDLKLREIGFAEGDEVEVLVRSPWGGRSLAVRLNRRIIALRRGEASAVRLDVAA